MPVFLTVAGGTTETVAVWAAGLADAFGIAGFAGFMDRLGEETTIADLATVEVRGAGEAVNLVTTALADAAVETGVGGAVAGCDGGIQVVGGGEER